MDENIKSSSKSQLLDISWGAIFKVAVAIISLYFLFLIKELIIWLLFALIISIVLEPVIRILSKRRIPRSAAVIFVYFSIFGILGLSLYLAIPFFVSEIQAFSKLLSTQIPDYFEKISPALRGLGVETFENFETFMNNLQEPFKKVSGSIFSTFVVFFGGLLATFFTISLAIFFSLEKGLMEKGLALFFPKRYENYLLSLWNRSKEKVTGWFLTRILSVIFVGILSYLAFVALKVDYPVSFAIFVGVFDFIPIIGPLVAAIFICAAVSLDSLLKAAFVLVALALIQVIENNVLMPVLTGKIIKISPALVLIALFIGGELWGILGAVLLVPLVAILFEFLKDFLSEKKGELFLDSSDKQSL